MIITFPVIVEKLFGIFKMIAYTWDKSMAKCHGLILSQEQPKVPTGSSKGYVTEHKIGYIWGTQVICEKRGKERILQCNRVMHSLG